MENENIKSDMENSKYNTASPSTLPLLTGSKSTDKLELSTLLVRNTKLARFCVMVAIFCSVTALAIFYGILIVLTVRFSASPEMGLVKIYVPSALCSVFQLFGGKLGDTVFGYYKTTKLGFICSMCGFVFMSCIPLLKSPWKHSYEVYWLVGLLVISIGVGLFKFNIACFGADQISVYQDHERRTFFNYVQVAAYIGIFSGFQVSIRLPLDADLSYYYMISGGLLLLGLIIFLIPRKSDYHITSPSQKLRCKCFKIIINAMRRNRVTAHEEYETFPSPKECLDRAKTRYGGKYADKEVDDIKRVFNTIPVWLFLIIYFTSITQLVGIFLIKESVVSCIKDSNQPFCWCLSLGMITTIILTPAVNRFGYPLLDKQNAKFPHIWRISIGMSFATLSLLSAGIVETVQPGTFWYFAVQQILMGASLVFVIPAVLEFAYCDAPKRMRSTVMSLFDIARPVGALLGVAFMSTGKAVGLHILPYYTHKLVTEVSQYDGNYTNASLVAVAATEIRHQGNLHYYFFLLATLNSINLIAFLIYGVRKSRRAKLDEDDLTAFIRANLYGSLTDKKNLITKDATNDFPELKKVNWFDEAS